MLDIVTVTYNSPPLPSEFAELAARPGWTLYVVDNASTVEPSVPAGARLVPRDANLGFGAACNAVLEFGSAPYILFLNPDCVIDADTVQRLLDIAADAGPPGVVVGPRTAGHPGQRTIPAGSAPTATAFLRQYTGVAQRYGGGFNAYERSTPKDLQSVDWVGGGCLLISRALFVELGGFSQSFFMYAEDVDLCLRAKDLGAGVLLAGHLTAHHPQGTGSPASIDLRMAWLRNLRVLVAARHGERARRRLDLALAVGAAQSSILKWLRLRRPSAGRPDLTTLRRHVFQEPTSLPATTHQEGGSAPRDSRKSVIIAHPSADRYGSDLQLLQSAAALADDGWEPVLVVPETGPLTDLVGTLELRIVGFRVLRKSLVSVQGLASLAAGSVSDLVRTCRLLRRTRPDLVYVNTLTIPIWIIAARLCRVPVLVHVHEAEESQPRVVRTALAAPLLLASTVVVNSHAAAETISSVIPKLRSRTSILHNGVPDPGVDRSAVVPGRVAYIGRLSPRKGVDVALEAVARLVAEGVDVTLDVCGSVFPGYEDYEAALRERAASPDLAGRVRFRGYVRPVADVLGRSEVLVMPSRAEPFGNVAVEALLAECPVVASRVQGLQEVVIDGETGVLVPPDDPEALAAGLRLVLADRGIARSLAQQGRRDALTRFSVGLYRERISRLALEASRPDRAP